MIKIEIEQENSDTRGASFSITLTSTLDDYQHMFSATGLCWDEAAGEVSRLISMAAGKTMGSFVGGHLTPSGSRRLGALAAKPNEWGRWVNTDDDFRIAGDEYVASLYEGKHRLILKKDWVVVGKHDDGTPLIVKATRAER